MVRHVMTPRRKAALRKAQLVSARKRRRRAATILAVSAGVGIATLTGRRVSSHVKLFKEAKSFQSSGFDPESGYGPGLAKYSYKEHLRYRRSIYKSHRKFYRNKIKQTVLGQQSKHPLANGLLVMQIRSGRYKYQSKPQKIIKTTVRYHQSMRRYKSDPTL